MEPADLPSPLAPLAFLVGTWVGEGRGAYPTVDDFTYSESTVFAPGEKPVLAYSQRTRVPPGGAASHAELGYLRPTPDGVELVVALPSGVVEVSVGTVAGTTVELASLAVVSTPTAKSVTEVRRRYERRGDTLSYRLDMAAVDRPLGFHLEGVLRLA